MNNSTQIHVLSVFMCPLIDIPISGEECSTRNPNICVKCNLKGGYFSGESATDYESVGHKVCVALWTVLMIVGILGLIGNAFIIAILKRRNSVRAFDILLMVLAAFDTVCCVISMMASTVHVNYFQGWIGGSAFFVYTIIISFHMMLFIRSTSIFATVLITIQSYCMIAFPITSMLWFTARRTKLLALGVLLLSVFLAIPRYLSVYVGENPFKEEHFNTSKLHEFPYLLIPTNLHEFFYRTLKGFHNQIDYWAPLPLLMLFKFMSYCNVRKLNKRRKELNVNQKKQIQAVTMFLPVVIVLFVCNFGPIVYYVFMHFKGIAYREMLLVVCLSTVLNSSVNFPIYYFRASNFRTDARLFFAQSFSLLQTSEASRSKKSDKEVKIISFEKRRFE